MSRSQGDREGRPYNTSMQLVSTVYCRGDPRGRPGFFHDYPSTVNASSC